MVVRKLKKKPTTSLLHIFAARDGIQGYKQMSREELETATGVVITPPKDKNGNATLTITTGNDASPRTGAYANLLKKHLKPKTPMKSAEKSSNKSPNSYFSKIRFRAKKMMKEQAASKKSKPEKISSAKQYEINLYKKLKARNLPNDEIFQIITEARSEMLKGENPKTIYEKIMKSLKIKALPGPAPTEISERFRRKVIVKIHKMIQNPAFSGLPYISKRGAKSVEKHAYNRATKSRDSLGLYKYIVKKLLQESSVRKMRKIAQDPSVTGIVASSSQFKNGETVKFTQKSPKKQVLTESQKRQIEILLTDTMKRKIGNAVRRWKQKKTTGLVAKTKTMAKLRTQQKATEKKKVRVQKDLDEEKGAKKTPMRKPTVPIEKKQKKYVDAGKGKGLKEKTGRELILLSPSESMRLMKR